MGRARYEEGSEGVLYIELGHSVVYSSQHYVVTFEVFFY